MQLSLSECQEPSGHLIHCENLLKEVKEAVAASLQSTFNNSNTILIQVFQGPGVLDAHTRCSPPLQIFIYRN